MLLTPHHRHQVVLSIIAVVLLLTGLYISLASGSLFMRESVSEPVTPIATSTPENSASTSSPIQPTNPNPTTPGGTETSPPSNQTPNSSATPFGGIVSIKGKMVCLPHRNTSGPQTLECAFGLHADNGQYYSLRDSDPTYKNVAGVSMNVDVVVEGFLTVKEDTKYQSSGLIEVKSITVADTSSN